MTEAFLQKYAMKYHFCRMKVQACSNTKVLSKAQNLQEIAHFQSEGMVLEWELVINCPIHSVNCVGQKIGSILLLPFYQMSKWFRILCRPRNDSFSQWVVLMWKEKHGHCSLWNWNFTVRCLKEYFGQVRLFLLGAVTAAGWDELLCVDWQCI